MAGVDWLDVENDWVDRVSAHDAHVRSVIESGPYAGKDRLEAALIVVAKHIEKIGPIKEFNRPLWLTLVGSMGLTPEDVGHHIFSSDLPQHGYLAKGDHGWYLTGKPWTGRCREFAPRGSKQLLERLNLLGQQALAKDYIDYVLARKEMPIAEREKLLPEGGWGPGLPLDVLDMAHGIDRKYLPRGASRTVDVLLAPTIVNQLQQRRSDVFIVPENELGWFRVEAPLEALPARKHVCHGERFFVPGSTDEQKLRARNFEIANKLRAVLANQVEAK